MRISLYLEGAGRNGPGDGDNDTPRARDVHDAAYHLAYATPGGVQALAARMGTNPNTLKHKLNPNNDTHHLTLREAMAMQVLSGRADILHAMAEELDHTCIPAVPGDPDADPSVALVELTTAMADFMRAVSEPMRFGDAARGGAVSRNEMRRAEHMAQAAIDAVGQSLMALRARMRPAPKVDY